MPGMGGAEPRGLALLHDPLLNKGTAFTEAERDALGVRGLLPPHVLSQDEQAERALRHIRNQPTPLEKYIELNALHDRNESLFFRLIGDHISEMQPLIYTPTVGLACQKYGHIFQRPRGLFVGANDRGRVEQVLRNWPYRPAIIVITDGERILGLGDLGANGMGIPVGKLSLYTACAGIDPKLCLPVMLDVGTNNEALLADPFYIGLRQRRLAGSEYDALVDEFVSAAQSVFPGVLIQFEDFANHNAFKLLKRYRGRICTFNDDIQGTAAVALAGLLSAMRITHQKLAEQKILFLGAGEAATGIAGLVACVVPARNIALFDVEGLVVRGRPGLPEHLRPYAHDHPPIAGFAQAVEALRPSVLIGASGVGGLFTAEVIGAMARINERPVVFALSNPTSKSECTAEEAYRWSGGRALFASGSPFEPVTLGSRTFVPRQSNNSYVFPGVGLGVIASRASRVPDEMFEAAAHALAARVSEADLAQGSLYPSLAQIREVSIAIATAVASSAWQLGIAGAPRPADIEAHVRAQMFEPRYKSYV